MPQPPSLPSLRRLAWRTAAACLAIAALASPPQAATGERHVLRGGEIEIWNIAGRASLVPATGKDLVITITRGGRDAAKLRIETGDLRGHATLRVVYPGTRVVYPEMGRNSRSETRVGEDGTFGGDWKSLFGGRTVRVSGGGAGIEAWADIEIAVPAGTRLLVHVVAGEMVAAGVEGDILLDGAASSVRAKGIKGDLTVDTGSGDVEVDTGRGTLSVDTGSGSVAVLNQIGGRLHIDTGSGEVRAADCKVDGMLVDTGSGSVTLRGITSPDVDVDTGSGSVVLELASSAEDVLVDTGSGSVTVSVPRGFGARYQIETGSGDIDVEVPHTSSQNSRGEARGRIGDGSGLVRIDTGSGSVRIRPLASSSGGSSSWNAYGLGGIFGGRTVE
jgi:hypothetical protein